MIKVKSADSLSLTYGSIFRDVHHQAALLPQGATVQITIFCNRSRIPTEAISSLGSNAATDGWAIRAISAAGQNPVEGKVGSADPIRHLLSLEKEDILAFLGRNLYV